MSVPPFEPREGGVEVVFDVPEAAVEDVTRAVSAAGFQVRRYYLAGWEPVRGGAVAGWVRLGAERPMREFTEAEQDGIVAAFDVVQETAPFSCTRIGTDSWTAGNDDGPPGARQ